MKRLFPQRMTKDGRGNWQSQSLTSGETLSLRWRTGNSNLSFWTPNQNQSGSGKRPAEARK